MTRTRARLTAEVVTNPVRSIAPSMSLPDGAIRFAEVDAQTIKMPLLYADDVRLRTYIRDIGTFASHQVSEGRMPQRAMFLAMALIRDAPDDLLARYGFRGDLDVWRRRARGFFGYHKRAVRTAMQMSDEAARARAEQRSFNALLEFWDRHEDILAPILLDHLAAAKRFMSELDSARQLFEPALGRGLLTIEPWIQGAPSEPGLEVVKFMSRYPREEDYVDEAADQILESFADSDAITALDLGAAKTVGLATPDQLSELDLASMIVEQLPTFERATIADIIDMRDELAGPLVEFRQYVVRLRTELADVPVSEARRAVNERWRSEIAPALQAIEDATRSNRYLAELTTEALNAPNWIPGVATFVLGLSSFQGLEQLVVAASGLAAVPLKALHTRARNRTELEKSHLFFVHRMSQGSPRHQA